jgi:hypothetical protein
MLRSPLVRRLALCNGETNMQLQLMCCEMVIENEIKQGVRRKDVALTYALTMQSEAQGRKADWKRINDAIIAKWGVRGLSAVKNRAWGIAEGRINPSS